MAFSSMEDAQAAVRECHELSQLVEVRVWTVQSRPKNWYAIASYNDEVVGAYVLDPVGETVTPVNPIIDEEEACDQVEWALSTSDAVKAKDVIDELSGASMFLEQTLTKRYLINDELQINDPDNGEPIVPRILYIDFYVHPETGELRFRQARLACATYL